MVCQETGASAHPQIRDRARFGDVPGGVGFLVVESLVKQFRNFFGGGVPQDFAALLQRLGKADGDILHLFMCFLRPAQEEHLRRARDAFVFIFIIETDAD